MEEDEIGEFLKSEEFIKGFREQVEKDTWGKGLPMVYLKDNKIVKHYSDGRVEVIKEIEFTDVKVENKNFKLRDENT